jgi:hypothetical protein
MQNFDNYMLETGAALWSMGEHYRYTRDDACVKDIAPKLLKSCEYIIQCCERNKDEKLRAKGYGTIEGQVAEVVVIPAQASIGKTIGVTITGKSTSSSEI